MNLRQSYPSCRDSLKFWMEGVLVCESCCNEVPQVGWLTQQKFIISQSQRCRSGMKVWARLVPSVAARGKLSLACSSFWQPRSFLVDSPLPLHDSSHHLSSVCVQFSPSSKHAGHIGLESTLMTAFEHDCLCHIFLSKPHCKILGVRSATWGTNMRDVIQPTVLGMKLYPPEGELWVLSAQTSSQYWPGLEGFSLLGPGDFLVVTLHLLSCVVSPCDGQAPGSPSVFSCLWAWID